MNPLLPFPKSVVTCIYAGAVDLFPLQVTLPDGTLRTTCRAHYDGRKLTVWDWDYKASAARTIIEAEYGLALPDPGPLPWHVELDGKTYVLAEQNGCGCGHPLKRHTTPPPARAYTTAP